MSYFSSALHPEERGERLCNLLKYLKNIKRKSKKVKFDAVVCSGVSGLLFAPLVADALSLHVVVVRKRSDKSTHSKEIVECSSLVPRLNEVLFVDDFIHTGETQKRVRTEVLKYFGNKNMKMWSYLYEHNLLVNPKGKKFYIKE